MFVSLAVAFFSASAVPAAAPAASAATAKPRKICRSETLIGSNATKRVCTIVQPRTAATPSGNADGAGAQQAAPRDSASGRN